MSTTIKNSDDALHKAKVMYDDIDKARDSQESMNNVYKKYASLYDGLVATTTHQIVYDMTAEQVAKYEKDTSLPILDIACGTGLTGQALHAKGFQCLEGVDLSLDMLEEAKKKNVYSKLSQGKITEIEGLECPDAYFQTLTCTAAISKGHIRPPWALREFLRITKPGGICVFTVNDKTNALGFIQMLGEAHQAGKCNVLHLERLPNICSYADEQLECYLVVIRKL